MVKIQIFKIPGNEFLNYRSKMPHSVPFITLKIPTQHTQNVDSEGDIYLMNSIK